MRIDRGLMWTNSTTGLQSLQTSGKQLVFVANPTAEILDLTTIDDWNQVQSADSSADAGTRGIVTSVHL